MSEGYTGVVIYTSTGHIKLDEAAGGELEQVAEQAIGLMRPAGVTDAEFRAEIIRRMDGSKVYVAPPSPYSPSELDKYEDKTFKIEPEPETLWFQNELEKL